MSEASDAEPEEAGAEPELEIELEVEAADDALFDELDEEIVEALVDEQLFEQEATDAPSSVEDLIVLLEATAAERDKYLDLARRTQAEFENHRKRSVKQLEDEVTRQVAELVEQLLPVLDACDAAIVHGSVEVEPIYTALAQTLAKRGLQRMEPLGEEFNPTWHEAVMHEPGDEDQEITIVSDVMRAGYAWRGRVVRPAMVKVKG